MDQRALVGAHELLELVLVLTALALVDDDLLGVDVRDRALRTGDHDVAGVDRRPALHPGADDRRVGDEQRHRLGLHVRAHQRAVRVVVLEERDHRGRDRPDLLRRDVDQVDLLGSRRHVLARLRPAQDLVADQVAGVIDRRVRLGDQRLLLLRGVEVEDLVGHLAVLDDPVGRRHEPVLGDLRVGGERADQADVRPLRGLDRAHPPVVGGVHVAHLDRRALAGQAAGAQRTEPPAMPEAGQAVRLVHELRQLARAEELLQRGHDRADVDDRLRGDRVGVLGGEALAHDPLHPVETDPERLLDQLADGPQTTVAEVLVLVEVILDRLARHRQRLGGEVLDLLAGILGHAETPRQGDELLDEGDDVVVGERPGLEVDVEPEPRVELVAPDARQVVPLGVEEQLVEQ